MAKAPSPLVLTERSAAESPEILTVAPGINASWASTTTPTMLPVCGFVGCCPQASVAARITAKTARTLQTGIERLEAVDVIRESRVSISRIRCIGRGRYSHDGTRNSCPVAREYLLCPTNPT